MKAKCIQDLFYYLSEELNQNYPIFLKGHTAFQESCLFSYSPLVTAPRNNLIQLSNLDLKEVNFSVMMYENFTIVLVASGESGMRCGGIKPQCV